MAPPTTIISIPKSVRSLCPSTSFATVDPATAPVMPAIVKTTAHGHLTFPERACATRLASALTETASALAPIATCGEDTPTP